MNAIVWLFNLLLLIEQSWRVKAPPPVAHWINPCSKLPLKATPTCDISKSFEERAYDLVYNQEAKLNSSGIYAYQILSDTTTGAISELNITEYIWQNEASHGIANSPGVSWVGKIDSSTMFPQVITTAASFNATLFHLIGQTISTEARAMNNNHQCGLTFWAPNINIFRDPRWGRGQETPGEDPYLNSVYAIGYVSGMEGNDDKYIKASSCCKHYADYSLEDSDNTDRHHFNAIVSEYDQNNTYLVAFKYCVIGGNASGIMCSYNSEDGTPSCANKQLLTDIMRNEYGFYGYITSDCGAVDDVQNAHHYTQTSGETINAVYSAGMDLNCGDYTVNNLANAVQRNAANLSDIQASIYRATLVQMRLGMFDSMTPWSKLGPADVCTNASLQLSLDASRQGIVLLKNMHNILPLNIDNVSNYKIALIGPNANNKDVMKGNYAGRAPFIYSVYDGLAMYINEKDINYQQGVDIDSTNTSGIGLAVNASMNADLVIIVMGLDLSQENEGNDRINITLPGEQNNLISQVSAASKGNVILIILSGGCVDISRWRDSNNINAIIWGGYGGMYGGRGIADVLFGLFNPTGRLDQTWYYQNYTQEMQMVDMNMRANKSTKSVGRGYRYYNGSVVYTFGYGLSYTTFECDGVVEMDNNLKTTVKNVGNVDGGAVVIVYFVPNDTGENELKRMVAFGRIDMLKVGDSRSLSMDIYPEHKNMNGKYVLGGVCSK